MPDGENRWAISSTATPSPADRTALAGRADAIGKWMAASGAEVIEPFVRVLLSHYRSNVDEADAQIDLDTYSVALAPLPVWAVAEACAMALRGKVGDSGGRYVPRAPDLYKAAERLMAPLVLERQTIVRVLSARVEEAPQVNTDERKAAIARIMSGAGLQRMPGNPAPRPNNPIPPEAPAPKADYSKPATLSAEAMALFPGRRRAQDDAA